MKKRNLLMVVAVLIVLACCVLTACNDDFVPDPGIPVTYHVFDDTYTTTASSSGNLHFSMYISHYDFLGLYDAPEGGSQFVDEHGNTVILITQSIELWSRWKPHDCMVKFDYDEEHVFNGALPVQYRLTYGEQMHTLPVAEEVEGYDFMGWENGGILITDANGQFMDDCDVLDDSHYKFENAPGEQDTVILRPKFELKKHVVRVHFNDGYENTTKNYEVEHGKYFYISEKEIELPEHDDMEFVGWSTRSDMYDNGGDVPIIINGDMDIFGIWKKFKTFRIYNGEEEIKYKVYLNDPPSLPELKKEGYEFEGLYTSQFFAGNPIPNLSYSSQDVPYYVHWLPIRYKITFHVNDVEGADDIASSSYSIETVTDTLYIPKWESYEFLGWCFESDLSDEPFTKLPEGTKGELDLYAKWQGVDKNVTLDAADGTVQEEDVTVQFGSEFTLEKPEYEGHTFLGWFTTTEDQITDGEGNGLEKWNIHDEETTLVAHWELTKYTVIFDANGGKFENGKGTLEQKFEYDSTLVLPEEAPTWDGWEVVEWCLDEDLSKPAAAEEVVVKGDMRLYMKWKQVIAISTPQGLRDIANDPELNYYLAQDINMFSANWTPIENFAGVLDGRGFKIYNFVINASNTADKMGLFATNSGIIQDLTLESVTYNYTVSGASSAGVLAGVNTGTISNCKLTKSTITLRADYSRSNSTTYFGGIVGDNQGTLEKCVADNTNRITINFSNQNGTQELCFGGIAGVNSKSIESCSTSVVCTATMTMTSNATSKYYAGGVAGRQTSTGSIAKCSSNYSQTVNLEEEGSGNSTSYVGGIVGEAKGGDVEYNKSNATLDVAAMSDNSAVGGLVGSVTSGASVLNCYAEATIKTERSQGTQIAGGLIGTIDDGIVGSSYSAGQILSQKGPTGGFIGKNSSKGMITNCFSLTKVTECPGETVGKFSGENAGTLVGCYYADDVYSKTEEATYRENETDASEKAAADLVRSDFAIDQLYWNSEAWTFAEEGATAPKLAWESEE